jgi:hypothetical protein
MPIEGTRDYIYRLEGDELNIYFPEQPLRLFQQITLSRQQDTGYLHANAYHRCSADDYRSSYCFKSEKDFTIVHRVTGPRKDYTLTTDYRRID